MSFSLDNVYRTINTRQLTRIDCFARHHHHQQQQQRDVTAYQLHAANAYNGVTKCGRTAAASSLVRQLQ